MKLNIAAISGGFSSEKVISEKSIKTIIKHLDASKYDSYHVSIDKSDWVCLHEDRSYKIDRSNFSVPELSLKFDFAFIMIHGTPGEDGLLQAYFDLLGIRHSTCNHQMSTLTFDKWACNNVLRALGYNCAKSRLLRSDESYSKERLIDTLGLPVFVKPNDGGSSFGISRVNKIEDLDAAISKARSEGTSCVIESFIEGYEVTVGAYRDENDIVVLPITEIRTTNEFFDFGAKYSGESQEITPAQIPNEIAGKVNTIVYNIYKKLGLEGLIRIDFMINNDEPYLIEINAVPGFSEASIVPQQIRAAGMTIEEVLDAVITYGLRK